MVFVVSLMLTISKPVREFAATIPSLLKASLDTKVGPVILSKPAAHPHGPLVHTTPSLIYCIGQLEILPQIGTEMQG